MTVLRALVIDKDEAFAELVRSSLLAYGVDVVVEADESFAIERFRAVEPDLVLIAVDLPRKHGFTLCSQIRRQSKRVPVILATATIPPKELELHQKLKVHANAYVDKRTLTHNELLQKITEVVDLGPSRLVSVNQFPLDQPPETGDATSNDADSEVASWVADLVAEATEVLAALEDDPATTSPDISIGPDSIQASRIAELESQVDLLQQDLEEARREAAGSPFSRDYAEMRTTIDKKQEEIVRLKEELFTRGRQILLSKDKLKELTQQLASTLREKEQELENTTALQEGLKEADRLTHRLQTAVEKVEAELVQAKKQIEDLKLDNNRLRLSVDAERQRSAAELQGVRESMEPLELSLKESRERLSAAEKSHQQTLEAKQRRHTAELEALQETHTSELEAQNAAHQQVLQQLSGEHAVAMRSLEGQLEALRAASAEHSQAQASRIDKLEQLLKQEEQKVELKDDELAKLRPRYEELARAITFAEQKLKATQQHHEEQLRRLEAAHETALRQEKETQKRILAEAQRDRQSLEESHGQEIARLKRAHAEATAERQQRLVTAKQQYEDQLATLQSSHEATLAREKEAFQKARAKSAEERQALVEGHRQEIARVEKARSEAAAEHRQRMEELQNLHTLQKKELEERSRSLAVERQSHDESRQRFDQRLADLKAQQAAENERLKSSYQEEIAALKAKGRDELEAVLRELETERAERRKDLESSMTSLEKNETYVASLERDHQAALLRKDEELRDAMARAASERATALAKLEAETAVHMQESEMRFKARLEELLAQKDNELSLWRRRYEDLSADFDQKVGAAQAERENLRTETAHQVNELEKALAKERAQSEELSQRLKQVEADHASHLDLLNLQRTEASELENQLKSATDRAVAAATREWEQRIEQLEAQHASAVSELEQQHEDYLKALTADHQRDLAKRDEVHKTALSRVSQERAEALTTTQGKHAEELERKTTEVADLSKRLERMMSLVSEEREKAKKERKSFDEEKEALRRELQAQLDIANQTHSDIIEALEIRYSKTIDALKEQNEVATAQLEQFSQSHSQDFESALAAREEAIREECGAEYQERIEALEKQLQGSGAATLGNIEGPGTK